LQTAPVSFFPDLNFGLYPAATNNLGPINIRPTLSGAVVSNQPFLGLSTQGRNAATVQLLDNFSWTKGRHNFSFGGTYTYIRLKQFFASTRVHTANIALNAADPAAGIFGPGNMPGSSSTDQGNAGAVYATLVGHVNTYTGTVAVDPGTRQFVSGGNIPQNTNSREFGFYGGDSWRVLPTLTLNYSVRWEYQGAPWDPDNITYRVTQGNAFGVSGNNNLFKPGTLTGAIPTFTLNGDRDWYNRDKNNWAPNVGFAWQPSMDNKVWKTLFGEAGKTVIRSAYSITFTREGLNNFQSIAFSNPGITGSIVANAVSQGAGGCAAVPNAGTFFAGCVTLTNLLGGSIQTLQTNPVAFPGSNTFQVRANSGQSVNTFDPNLHVPLVHNWTLGIQREITPSMVFEVRYVGNHGSGLWRQDSVNEVNIFENGFLTEFANARTNLSHHSGSFANLGAAGDVPVPILTAAFTGSPTGSQANANFANGTFITFLNNGAAGALAANLSGTTSFLCNLVGSVALQGTDATSPCAASAPAVGSQPVNFWTANPNASGGGFRIYNGANSTFNALTLEVRQREVKGLRFTANYTYGKALSDLFADSSASFLQYTTLRNREYDKGPSPWDLRHVFKADWQWALPFGPGRKWSSGNGVVDHIIDGWEFSGINRWQSGRVFLLTSGNNFRTVNGNDAGVSLVGLNRNQLQSMLSIRKTTTGLVYYVPSSLLASNGTANSSFITPCTTAGQLCQRVFLNGPSFFRMDLNVVKNIRITERVRMQVRAEFLNAFNNINFFYPGSETTSVPTASITGTSFGQVTNAYRDVSTTDDNGGRIIQFVLRVNF
jgi:hypothetical protein